MEQGNFPISHNNFDEQESFEHHNETIHHPYESSVSNWLHKVSQSDWFIGKEEVCNFLLVTKILACKKYSHHTVHLYANYTFLGIPALFSISKK